MRSYQEATKDIGKNLADIAYPRNKRFTVAGFTQELGKTDLEYAEFHNEAATAEEAIQNRQEMERTIFGQIFVATGIREEKG